MKVCLDTNVLLQLFRASAPFQAILHALFDGRLALVLSNEIRLEYKEVVTRRLGVAHWQEVAELFETFQQLHGNIVRAQPTFRFAVITADPDDNKFVDAAIVAGADFIITEDRHFRVLAGAGYRPQPIRLKALMQAYL